MNSTLIGNSTYRNTMLAAGLAFGLCIGTANAATEDSRLPQAHSDDFGATVDDTVNTNKVKSNLMGEHSLKKSDINVTTTNGVVTLDGSASSSKTKSAAESVTKTVDGVKSIDNNLKAHYRIATVTKTNRVMTDSGITIKAKSEMNAGSFSKTVNVSIKTLHGVVMLKGSLPNQGATSM